MSRKGRVTVELDASGKIIGQWASTTKCSIDIGVPVAQLYTNMKFGWRTLERTFAFADTLTETLDWGDLPKPHGKKYEKIVVAG
jgi:hypothetical protein